MIVKTFNIVVTTINYPTFLDSYARNFRRHGYEDRVTFFIIPDRKTPPGSDDYVRRFVRQGFDFRYISLREQEDFMARFGDLKPYVPYNSDNRRNIGYLLAMEKGGDILISIDDDNYCRDEEDFCGCHGICGELVDHPVVHAESGFFNICSLLISDSPFTFYPRGFPYFARKGIDGVAETVEPVRVGANAGLWVKSPDIDAVSRLAYDVQSQGFTGKNVVLGRNTLSPVNTQNTSMIMEAGAAYYYILMGNVAQNLRIDRFGDIWSGYFLQKCLSGGDLCVRVGNPVVDHIRNRHDLLHDLKDEMAGILITEELVPLVQKLNLVGETIADRYGDLARKLAAAIQDTDSPVFSKEVKKYFGKITGIMKIWADISKVLLKQ